MAGVDALTPSTVIQTNSPFVVPKTENDGKAQFDADPQKKVTIEAHAEFLEYNFPGSRFSSKGPVRFIYDLQGQPLVFSISTEQVCIVTGLHILCF
jgi:hypothetical protein